MISNYELVNNELNITLSFNYEIGNLNFIKNINLKKRIIKLANKLKTNKVNIFVNGLLITTILLTPTKLNSNYNDKITYLTNNTIKTNYNEPYQIYKDNNIITTVNEIENNLISTKKIKETSIETKKEVKENIENNNTYITLYRNNGTVLTLELEEYLIGVVGSEMPASFNIEALKAQAVVARTYALKRIDEGKVLTDTVSTQVYKNNEELKNMWGSSYDTYYNKIKNAVDSTKGLVITYDNKYIDAVYHSTSNGMTEDSIYVWGYSLPYLKSVNSEYDKNVSSYKRDTIFSFEKISDILNTEINENTNFELIRNDSNRVVLIKINDIEIKGTDFRNKLNLRSTDFNIGINDSNICITTYGYGHGVGMSQYGANEMAKLGFNYIDILNHYYTNIKIKA